MIGRRISHYRILETLGEGGMGVVYKAEDTKLKRTVALKFLRAQDFGSAEHRDRFIREAQTAAALDHPNICTIYEIDEADSEIFISMAFVDGVNLKNIIRSGPLDIEEALSIAIQVARGLESAHERGVIHRDIKSSNVMVTKERCVKITDFGLARIAGGEQISKTTTDVGTASYMSPEQGRGEVVDHRTDIWSLGVVMYEMLTGELPFKGEYDPAVVYSLLNDEPAPVTRLRPDVPVELEAIIKRAMEKDPQNRYQNASEMIAALKKPRDVIKSPKQIAEALTTAPQRSIAVLPFVDLSPKQDHEYFCDGVAEEIINALTRVNGLRVVSRTSAFSFKGKNSDIRDIGRTLNVETVLEGSVRTSGNQLRITGQLVSVSDGYHLWSEQYDRELEDVFAIQEEIAESIVQALEVRLNEKGKRVIEKAPPRNVQAYDFYLRGRQYFYQSKKTSMNYACEMFSKAIKRDPEYALAYAGLADCCSYQCLYFGGSEAVMKKALEASAKALELDGGLAEAHAAKGLALSVAKKYKEAEEEFERAVRLDPKLFEAYYFYARMCYAQGKMKEAIEMYHRAGEANPDDYQAPSLEAFTYRTMNRMDEAKEAYRRSLENIERHVELNPDDSRAIFLGATALVDLGERDEALRWVKRAQAIDPDDPYLLYGVACFYSRIDEVEKAFSYLEQAFKAGFAYKEWIEHDIDLDPIRDDARFAKLMATLG
ncbi:MAG: protein kinase [Candidatus Latescibacterota bacterium]|nr:MAG: protein kinase [Candidatus Latescibacterota bacterium]